MKVLLIDNQPLILSALQTVIRGMGEDTTVIEADSVAAARQAWQGEAGVDLVLLDMQLGVSEGVDLLAELRAAHPGLPVVAVSDSERPGDIIRAIDAGAMGFLPKRASNQTLYDALRMVMSGGIYVPPMTLQSEPAGKPEGDTVPSVLRVAREAMDDSGFHSGHAPLSPLADLGLTPRQTDVLALLLKGQPNKLIARELNLSIDTVKDHVAAVLRALGVSNRTQAVLAVGQLTHHPGGTADISQR